VSRRGLSLAVRSSNTDLQGEAPAGESVFLRRAGSQGWLPAQVQDLELNRSFDSIIANCREHLNIKEYPPRLEKNFTLDRHVFYLQKPGFGCSTLSCFQYIKYEKYTHMKIKSDIVLGLGKVGSLVGTLLYKTGFEVIGADIHAKDQLPFPVVTTDMANMKRFTYKI
jgi:hypothetical protein